MTDVPPTPPPSSTPPPGPGSQPPPAGNPPPGAPFGLNYGAAGYPNFTWTDFLTFRTMIAVPVIMVLFWVAVIGVVIAGIGTIFSGQGMPGVCAGLGMILFGPFVVRLQCEFLIVVFRINQTATEILDTLRGRPPQV